MEKLLLTSAGFENPKIGRLFLKLVKKPANEIKVIFIPAAAITGEEKYYVKKSEEELLSAGIKHQNIKVLELEREIPYKDVENFDVIYVCGGNTFYLLNQVRNTGFDKTIKECVKNGKLYVGVSAGSILVGPNIKIACLGDKNECGLKNFTGLNLIDMAISPHANAKNDIDTIIAFAKQAGYKILPLADNQALLVLDDKAKIIE